MTIKMNKVTKQEAIKISDLEFSLSKVISRTGLEEIMKETKEKISEYPQGTSRWLDRVEEEYDIAEMQRLIIRKEQLFNPNSTVKNVGHINMSLVLKKASQTKLRRGISTISNFINTSKKEFKSDWERIKQRFELSR